MRLVIISLITGMATGVLFSLLKLPIPAPPTLAGVTGIVGVYLGYVLINSIMK